MTFSSIILALGAAVITAIAYELRDALRDAGDAPGRDTPETQDDFHMAMQRQIERDRRMPR